MPLVPLATVALLGGAAGWLLARRRGGAGAPPAEPRLATVERELDAARALLRDYIVDREGAEETLRETAERYRAMFGQHGAVQLLIDNESGRIVDANDAACEFYGYDRATLTSMGIADINMLPPEEVEAEMARAANARRPYFVFPHRLASGEIRVVEVHAAPVTLRGHVLFYSIVHDMTDRRRAEDALAASEARYRSLIARAAYGIYRSSPEGRFLEVNPALVTMLGYPSAEALMAVDMTRDVYADGTQRRRLMGAGNGDGTHDWIDVVWKRQDGTLITVRLSTRSVRDRAGNILYYEGIAEDVTERLRQEEMLRRSERMASLGHTLAGAAHELNNPLAAICGFAQLLLRDATKDDDRSALETINHEAARAGKIVKDLLVFARRQEGERRVPVNVNRVAAYILDSQRYAIETRGIRRDVALAPDLPMVLGDVSQLEQVILNLVVNARQALESALDAVTPGPGSPRGAPWIALRTRYEDGQVRIEIADNGPGIPTEELSRIWDPFWTTKPEGEGTGLGLSVVHGIVTSHGGSILVESEPGTGTRFVVCLPPLLGVPALLPPSAGDETLASETPAATPLDVLLVDDEPALLGFLTRYLARRGHAVIAVPDGDQALRVAEHTSFDVVLCDLRLPGMDGAELVRRLRATSNAARARFVIAIGDDAGPEARDEVAALAVTTVLEKPYAVEQVRAAVEA